MQNHSRFPFRKHRAARRQGLSSLLLVTAALGCDIPTEEVDGSLAEAEDSVGIEEADDATAISPILASVETEDGVTVEFVAVSERTVGIAVGGPVEVDFSDVFSMIAASESPVEALAMLSDDSIEPSEDFAIVSDAVVQAGNWLAGQSRAEDLTQRATDGVENEAAQAEAPQDLVTEAAPPQAASCGSLWGYGSNLVNDSGHCILNNYPHFTVHTWTWNDGIAFAAHVMAVSGGRLDWKVRHANCGACNWTQDYSKAVYAGENWYYWTADTNDDFNAQSEVKNLSGTWSQFYHKAVQIHDYRGRTVGGAPGGKAGIMFDSSSQFCTTLNYKGPDPSNIFTSASWGDGPGWSNCG